MGRTRKKKQYTTPRHYWAKPRKPPAAASGGGAAPVETHRPLMRGWDPQIDEAGGQRSWGRLSHSHGEMGNVGGYTASKPLVGVRKKKSRRDGYAVSHAHHKPPKGWAYSRPSEASGGGAAPGHQYVNRYLDDDRDYDEAGGAQVYGGGVYQQNQTGGGTLPHSGVGPTSRATATNFVHDGPGVSWGGTTAGWDDRPTAGFWDDLKTAAGNVFSNPVVQGVGQAALALVPGGAEVEGVELAADAGGAMEASGAAKEAMQARTMQAATAQPAAQTRISQRLVGQYNQAKADAQATAVSATAADEAHAADLRVAMQGRSGNRGAPPPLPDAAAPMPDGGFSNFDYHADSTAHADFSNYQEGESFSNFDVGSTTLTHSAPAPTPATTDTVASTRRTGVANPGQRMYPAGSAQSGHDLNQVRGFANLGAGDEDARFDGSGLASSSGETGTQMRPIRHQSALPASSYLRAPPPEEAGGYFGGETPTVRGETTARTGGELQGGLRSSVDESDVPRERVEPEEEESKKPEVDETLHSTTGAPREFSWPQEMAAPSAAERAASEGMDAREGVTGNIAQDFATTRTPPTTLAQKGSALASKFSTAKYGATRDLGDLTGKAASRFTGTVKNAMNRWDAARTSATEQVAAVQRRGESLTEEAVRRGGAVLNEGKDALDEGVKHIGTFADMAGAAKKDGVKGVADKLAEKAEDAKKEGRETSWGDRAMQLSAVMGLTSDLGSLLDKDDNNQQPYPAAAPTIINMGGGGGYGGDFTNTTASW